MKGWTLVFLYDDNSGETRVRMETLDRWGHGDVAQVLKIVRQVMRETNSNFDKCYLEHEEVPEYQIGDSHELD